MAAGLSRSLTLFDATLYGVGIILGAGIYALIGPAAGMAGNAVWLSFVFGAVLASITGLSYAELCSIFPREAAEYNYTKEAFHSKGFAFIIGWLMLITGSVAAAAVAMGFGGYFQNLTGINMYLAAAVLVMILSFLNFWGIKQSSKFNIIFTILEIVGLLVIIIAGLAFGNASSINFFEMPNGISGVFGAAALIFFAFLGFESITNMSEEIKNPTRNVPIALLTSIAITTVIYMLVSIAAVSLLPWQQLAASSAPLAAAIQGVFPGAGLMLSLCALFATSSTVLVIMIVQSRIAYGMARGGAFPSYLGRIHKTRKTPWVAIAVIMSIVLGFLFIRNIKVVAEVANFGVFITFIAINAALIALRYKAPDAPRKFRMPLSIGKFPVLPVFGIIFSAAMMFNLDPTVYYIGLGVIAVGILVYLLEKAKLQKQRA